MLHFTIESSHILLDTAVFSIYISTPFVLTIAGLVVVLRARKLWRDRNRKVESAPIFDKDLDWNS
jgi:hypothetical protein